MWLTVLQTTADFVPKTGLNMCVSNLKENADVKGIFYIKENNHQIAGFISKINRHSHIEHSIEQHFFPDYIATVRILNSLHLFL